MKRLDVMLTQTEKADAERDAKVFKSDVLLQKARYSLSVKEQRFLLYVISKIEPDHDVTHLYDINLGDFQRVCGTEGFESFEKIKRWIKELADKSWYIKLDGKNESLIRWLNDVEILRDANMIRISFTAKMFPYLFKLAESMRESGQFYTGYALRNVLPMRSTYSIRLYELLKAYQKNNRKWWFALDELRFLLDCEKYQRYPDFRRYVLEPAEREINLYTDIKVKSSTVNQGRKVVAIEFTMLNKTYRELVQANHDGLTEIEGAVHYWDINQTSAENDG